jgi:endoglucanase
MVSGRERRSGMPDHTLILSGDRLAVIEGLVNVEPVADDSVGYCFGLYEPLIFTFQGGPWASGCLRHLQHVPYPSSPEAIEDGLADMLVNVPSALRTEAEAALRAYGEERWNAERVAARLRMVLDWAAGHGDRALWVTVWGVYHAVSPAADRYAFIRDAREQFDAPGVGWAYWSYAETQTVLTPELRVDLDMVLALGLTMQDG